MQRNTFTTLWLLVAAAVCGAVVMAVELLGARMLSVGYGASLTVWAAMISVTLLSLAVGYFIGGALADWVPRPWLLHSILILAGALVAVCPHLRFVLQECYGTMGLRAGALVSSLAIFSAPLVLLGMTGPFVIRVMSGGRHVGITAGGVYAVSTLGSVAGTLLAGLYLIPEFGVATGFRIAAGAAALTGSIGLIAALGGEGTVVLLLPLAVGLAPGPKTLAVGDSFETPTGEPVIVIDIRESAHGRIVVLEKGDAQTGERLLLVNGIQQTGVSRRIDRMERGDHLRDDYNYFQELLPYTVEDPAGRKALLIGLAGGLTATLLQKHDIQVDAVDLDPEIIQVAQEKFSFRGTAVAADGRRYLEDCEKKYDFCIIDTYSGDVFPFYMASVEAFEAVKGVLEPEGVLAINFIGSPTGRPFACVYKTLSKVFPEVHAIRCEKSDDVQTITLFASARPLGFGRKRWLDDTTYSSLDAFGGSDPGADPGEDPILEAVESLTVAPQRDDGIVLTDAYNPIDFIRTAEAVRWRQLTVERIGEGALF